MSGVPLASTTAALLACAVTLALAPAAPLFAQAATAAP